MSKQPDDEAAARRSNRRTLVGIGLVMLVFAGPLVYALGRYLISKV